MLRAWTVLACALVAASLWSSASGSARNGAFIGYREKDTRDVAETKTTDFKVKISSGYGEFIIKLRPDLAPDTCLLVWQLAMKGSCPNCKFYRHEPVPSNWSVNGYWGPPYALLQGSLTDLARQPPFENKAEVSVKKGHACTIPNCKEFFIATADHPEWGHSHTIWGEVEDLSAEPNYPFEPFHTATSDKITTRWLDNTYAFNLTAVQPLPTDAGAGSDAAAAAGGSGLTAADSIALLEHLGAGAAKAT
ncbi:hypothetical protein HYH03_009467 [Edaphochlamys debaryana]|uniref:PPIase cyclophilin-type domain-containing protein n=1 Tax=Edaphochlamys debaryana TaxID=47281 RepID=A0A836BXR4_9CHLO|nr:hypothetical protein HYH03_009467 [Edaphochlamys debaryana]|eukprot:KAG2492222.1 hypothetical protein HYH03_009467 [Edaphochlamys debaryana]